MAHFLPRNPSIIERFNVATDLVPLGTGERHAPTFGVAMANDRRTMQP